MFNFIGITTAGNAVVGHSLIQYNGRCFIGVSEPTEALQTETDINCFIIGGLWHEVKPETVMCHDTDTEEE